MTFSRTIKFSLAVFLFLVVGAIIIFAGYGWFLNRMARVDTGTARPTFPYSDYSVEELNKLYPQYITYDNVITIQSPNETYIKFKQALRERNIVVALSLITGRYKNNYERIFEEAKISGNLDLLYSKLEENINKDANNCNDVRCTYVMKISGQEIEFIKNSQGIWLIESL